MGAGLPPSISVWCGDGVKVAMGTEALGPVAVWDELGSVRDVPDIPALYVMWCGSSLMYVGSTGALRARLIRHRSNIRQGLRAGDVGAVPTHYGWIAMPHKTAAYAVEQWLIGKLCPPWNWAGPWWYASKRDDPALRARVRRENDRRVVVRRDRWLAEHTVSRGGLNSAW